MSDRYPYTMGEWDAYEHAREEAEKEAAREKAEIESKEYAPRYASEEEPSFTPEEVGRWVREGVYDPLMARLVLLEMRVKELEESTVKDAGVWKSDRTYRPQDQVTHRGTTWVAQVVCEGSAPGKSSDWRMTRKTGQ